MSLFATALLACSPAAPGTLAAPADDQEVFAMYSAGAPKLLSDPRDRNLLAALSMLDERLAELPQETGGEVKFPPDVVPLLARLIGGPMSLRVGIGSEPIDGMPVPIFAQVSLPEADPETAQATAGRIASLLAKSPRRSSTIGSEYGGAISRASSEGDATSAFSRPAIVVARFIVSGTVGSHTTSPVISLRYFVISAQLSA